MADAASRPLHWIYDLPDLEKAIKVHTADLYMYNFSCNMVKLYFTVPCNKHRYIQFTFLINYYDLLKKACTFRVIDSLIKLAANYIL